MSSIKYNSFKSGLSYNWYDTGIINNFVVMIPYRLLVIVMFLMISYIQSLGLLSQ